MTDEATRLEAKRIEGFGMSEDGKFALMKFGAADDANRITVTMPVENLADFYQHLGKLVGSLTAAGKISPPAADGHVIGKWKVGQSNVPALAKFTALLFDEGSPKEALFLLGDLDALKLADAIEQKVFKGLTPEQQRDLVRKVEQGARPKIILPGTSH